MIPAIIIGRGGSKGFPGKNFTKINGFPLMSYPIMAAIDSNEIGKIYFSTEDKRLKNIALEYGAEIIDRPKELAVDGALGEDVFVHAYNIIGGNNYHRWNPVKGDIDNSKEEIKFVVLMFANSIGVVGWMVDEMIDILRKADGDIDSICTVSSYPAFSPYRMRKINKEGLLEPFVDDLDWGKVDCDRDSGITSYIYDCCCAVVKPRCLENISGGLPPQRWLGKKILPYDELRNEIPCLDIDYQWQLNQVKEWIELNWI